MNSFESQPKKLELCPRESGMFLSGTDQAGSWHGPWMGSRCRPPWVENPRMLCGPCGLVWNRTLYSSQLFTSWFKYKYTQRELYFVTRMPVNENRTTKAKHIYYQMPPVDHCYRENISRGYARGEVRKSFFFLPFCEKATIQKIYMHLTSPFVKICKHICKML